MDFFRFPSGLSLRGDEFSLDDYPLLSDLQFSTSEQTEGIAGGADAPIARPLELGADIEVFEEAHVSSDIYSMSDDERTRLFTEIFDGDLQAAISFSRLYGEAARVRATLRAHGGVETTLRQLMLAGQDARLFDSILIVPRVRIISSATIVDRLKRNNLQQVIRGHIVRTRHTKKQAVPEITIAQPTAGPEKKTPTSISGIQFPRPIRAFVIGTSANSYETIIPRDTSIVITGFSIHAPGALPLFCAAGSAISVPDPLSAAYERPADEIQDDADIPFEKPLRALMRLRFIFANGLQARSNMTMWTIPMSDGFAPNRKDHERDVHHDEHAHTIEVAEIPEAIIDAAALLGLAPSVAFSSNIIADFSGVGMSEVLWQLQFGTAPQVEKVISRVRAETQDRAVAVAEGRKYIAQIRRLEIIALLIEDNYGLAKLPSATRKLRVGDETALLAKLTAAERKFILAEYDRIWRTAATAITTPCKHYDLVARLRTTTNLAALGDILSNLLMMTESAKSRGDAMIKCSVCGVDAICPHTVALLKVIVARGTRQQEKDAVAPFIERMHTRGMYYCSICGEHFEATFVNDESDGLMHPETENVELSDDIYKEMMMIRRYIRAQKVVDQVAFVRMVSRQIYPFVDTVNNRLTVAQTSAAAELKAKLRIFIAIYIFADCIVNKERFGIVFDGFVPRAAGNPEALAVKYVIDKIMLIENVSLAIVPNITREIIKTNLISAIGQLRTVASAMPFEPPPRDWRAAFAYDPIFALLYFNRGFAKKRMTDPFAYRGDVFNILSSKAPNPRNVYEPLIGVKVAKRQTTLGAIIDFALEGIKLRNFDHWGSITREIADYRERFAAFSSNLVASERKLIIENKKRRGVPLAYLVRVPDETDILIRTPSPLSAVYDVNGIEHKWGILIFKKLREVPTKDESNIIEIAQGAAEAFSDPSAKYVDRKCTVCGVLRSETDKIDEAQVRATIAILRDVQNLYRFFELRCPKEGTHTFDDKLVCTKCGYSRARAQKLDRAFYDENVAQFHAAIETEESNIRKVAPADMRENVPDLAAPWVYNYETIVSASDKLKVSRHDLLLLGGREGLTREELADESFVARIPKARVDTRIFALRS